jgi:putative ABC transport system permease protein
MIQNYVKVALRNLHHHRVYTVISTLGMSVGISAFLALAFFVQNEYSVNESFDDDLYRVSTTWSDPSMGLRRTSFAPMGNALNERLPSVESHARFSGVTMSITTGNQDFREVGIGVNPKYFETFSFEFVAGKSETALERPGSVVLSEKIARKFFGTTQAVGKTFRASSSEGSMETFTVTGVIEEREYNSITYLDGEDYCGIFFPMEQLPTFLPNLELESWSNHWMLNFVKLKEGTDPATVESVMAKLVDSNVPEELADKATLELEPVQDLYLNADDGAARLRAQIMAALAIALLLVAGFNFVSLMTSQALTRGTEVGMRKALGARRWELVVQYLSESLIIVVLSTAVGIGGGALLVQTLSGSVPYSITVDLLDPWILASIVLVVLLVGCGAGFYPAFYLSGIETPSVLRQRATTSTSSTLLIRRILVTAQVAVSIILIIGATTASRQAEFLTERDPGFEPEDVLVVTSVPRNWSTEGVDQLRVLRNRLEDLSGVERATFSYSVPGENLGGNQPLARPSWGSDRKVTTWALQADAHYLETLGIELSQGRFFSRQRDVGGDSENGEGGESGEDSEPEGYPIVLNETAARALNLEDPVGARVAISGGSDNLRVIGVVEDYHYESLRTEVKPLMMTFLPLGPYYRYMAVRLADNAQTSEVQAQIRDIWDETYPNTIFDSYYLDQKWEKLYAHEQQVRDMAWIGSLIILGLTCVGLVGMVSMSTTLRSREIGIRKAYGATSTNILTLLSRELGTILGAAVVVAVPIGYVLVVRWLERFPYRIDLSWFTPLTAVVAILATTVLVTSYHVLKAAGLSPLQTMRST